MVFRLGTAGAVVSDRDGVKIIGPRGEVKGTLRGSSVLGVVRRQVGGDRTYAEAKSGITWLDSSEHFARHKSETKPRHNGQFAGVTEGGELIFFGDTDNGSFIWKVAENGNQAVLAIANNDVTSILTPEWKTIEYSVSGQMREGLLLFPTVSRFGKRPPVIVTAYPLDAPLLAKHLDTFTSVSSVIAWRYQPLLAAGFALFVADFRAPKDIDP